MHAPLYSTTLPSRVLLLSGQECSVRTEIATLHSLGVTALMHHTSEKDALHALSGSSFSAPGLAQSPPAPADQTDSSRRTGRYTIDILVCEEIFASRQALFFLHELAKHPQYSRIPVLVITRSEQAAEMVKKCGITALPRPYTQKDLSEALARALSPMRRPLSVTRIAGMCERLSPKKKDACANTAPALLRAGLQALACRQAEKAEKAFLAALRLEPDMVEACLNLAKLEHSRGNKAVTVNYLLRAAASCKRRGLVEQEESIRALLPPEMKRNDIFMQEAVTQLAANNYHSAAQNLLDHCADSPERQLHAAVARACQMTPSPQQSIEKLCGTFEKMGQGATAARLRRRLLCDGEEAPPVAKAIVETFPRLKEWLNIATHTAWAWRQV